MKKAKLFVCLSHPLTQEQKDDFIAHHSGAEILELRDAGPMLQERASNIDPMADSEEIGELASGIVALAKAMGATHFCCQGEPCLMVYCAIVGQQLGMEIMQSTTARVSQEQTNEKGEVVKTSVFKHVQWRQMF